MFTNIQYVKLHTYANIYKFKKVYMMNEYTEHRCNILIFRELQTF